MSSTPSPHKPPTTLPPLLLLGGGGHAIVIADAARSSFDLVGFLDDDPDAPLSRPPQPLLRIGSLRDLARIADRPWIVAVGNLAFRADLLHTLDQLELARTAATVIHPAAYVSPTATLGRGVFIGPGAIVHARARIADHAIINSGAIIEHDTLIEPNAHIAPGAILGGGVRIGSNTLVGLGSRVLPSLSIGDHATVGAGAVVTRSLPDHAKAVGVPARTKEHGWRG